MMIGERSRCRLRVDGLEHEPRVAPGPSRAHAPVAVGVVAAARSGLRLRRLRRRLSEASATPSPAMSAMLRPSAARSLRHGRSYVRRSSRDVRPSRRIISVKAMASARRRSKSSLVDGRDAPVEEVRWAGDVVRSRDAPDGEEVLSLAGPRGVVGVAIGLGLSGLSTRRGLGRRASARRRTRRRARSSRA